jgi:hypothetical protein
MNRLTAEELKTRDDRRHHIAALMLAGEWRGGTSRRVLAEAWGYKLHDVVQLEREAAGSIRLARSPEWRDEVTAALAELDEVIATARTTVKVIAIGGEPHEYSSPALSAMVSAIRTKLQVYGALTMGGAVHMAPKTGDDDLEKLSRAERIALLEQALAEERGQKEQRH